MSRVNPTSIISHWNHMVPGIQQSSNEFYGEVDRLVQEQHLGDTKLERVTFSEGGLLSAKREYLQVRRKDHVFHVCAAPFATGFFVSWWLGEVESGLWALLTELPFVGNFFRLFRSFAKPLTYHRIDTALMFQSVTHGAVITALDAVLSTKGLHALTETEQKPVMRDFFAKI